MGLEGAVGGEVSGKIDGGFEEEVGEWRTVSHFLWRRRCKEKEGQV